MKRLAPTLLTLAIVVILAAPAVAGAADSWTIPNPLGSCTTIWCVLVRILQTVLALLGVVGVFMFIWGGYQFILAGGNPEMVKRGKATLFWSAIGLMIVIGSWVIIRFLLTTVTNSTS